MTTTPDAPTTRHEAPHLPDADGLLAQRATTTAVRAGLIAAGMVNTAGRPDRLPRLLWPDVDPEVVQAIWDQAVAVCTWANRFTAGPRWDTEGLERAHAALADAGWEQMAGAVRTAMAAAPSQHPRHAHPADRETGGARR